MNWLAPSQGQEAKPAIALGRHARGVSFAPVKDVLRMTATMLLMSHERSVLRLLIEGSYHAIEYPQIHMVHWVDNPH